MFPLKFIITSLELDVRVLKYPYLSIGQRLEFIAKKYYIIFKHSVIKPFKLGDKIKLFEKSLFYDSKYGIAGMQSMMTRHNRLLDTAKVRDVKTVLDCGANVGFYSLFIAQKYPQARVTAFEPVPKVYQLLKMNVQYQNIHTENVALSNTENDLYMKFDEADSVTSKVTHSGELKVRSTSMDSYIAENKINQIDILKIDTEGFEVQVLKGATKALEKTRYLVLEVNLLEEDYSISQLLSYLYSDKYDFQLRSYRNYSGKAEGEVRIMDILLENILFNERKQKYVE